VAALARLEPSSAQPLFQALNAADARRVAALWQQRPTGARVPLPALAAAAEPLAGAPLQHLLRAAVALQRDHPGTLDARTLQLLAALADGQPATPASPTTPADRAQAAAAFDRWLDADERAALAARRGMGAPHRQPAAHGSADPGAEGSGARPPPAPDAGQTLRFHSPHGGVLRLWVVMHWLRWPERLQRLLATALAGPGHGPSVGPRHTLHAGPGQAMSPNTADAARQADGAASAATLARATLLHAAARALRAPLHGGRWSRRPPGLQEDAATLAVLRDPGLRALCLPDTTDPVPDLLDRHALALRWAWRGLLSAPDSAGAPAGQASATHAGHPRHARHAQPAGPAPVLLAALADRVPGCAGASADYLRRHLLEGQASLVVDPVGGHADAQLDRPPLHVLLMLSGLSQARFALGGLTLRLRCEPDPSP